MLKRDSVEIHPEIIVNPEHKNFYDITMDDIKINGYHPRDIATVNPQFKIPVAV